MFKPRAITFVNKKTKLGFSISRDDRDFMANLLYKKNPEGYKDDEYGLFFGRVRVDVVTGVPLEDNDFDEFTALLFDRGNPTPHVFSVPCITKVSDELDPPVTCVFPTDAGGGCDRMRKDLETAARNTQRNVSESVYERAAAEIFPLMTEKVRYKRSSGPVWEWPIILWVDPTDPEWKWVTRDYELEHHNLAENLFDSDDESEEEEEEDE